MDNSGNELDFKSIFVNYIILITLCLFVVIYIIINYDIVRNGNIYGGDITKSVLLTGIIILLVYLLATWDDDNVDSEKNITGGTIIINQPVNDIEIPKFSLADVNNLTKQNLHYQPTQSILPVQPTQSILPVQPTQSILPIQSNPKPLVQVNYLLPNGNLSQNEISSIKEKVGQSKYRLGKIGNGISIPNNSFGNQSVEVKYNNPMTNLTEVKRHIDKLSNQNIFVAQKNSLRYGIKF